MIRSSPIERQSISLLEPVRFRQGEQSTVRCFSRTFLHIRETPYGRLADDKMLPIGHFKRVHIFSSAEAPAQAPGIEMQPECDAVIQARPEHEEAVVSNRPRDPESGSNRAARYSVGG